MWLLERNDDEEFIILALLMSLFDDSKFDMCGSADDSEVEEPYTFGFLGCKGSRDRFDMFSGALKLWTCTVM